MILNTGSTVSHITKKIKHCKLLYWMLGYGISSIHFSCKQSKEITIKILFLQPVHCYLQLIGATVIHAAYLMIGKSSRTTCVIVRWLNETIHKKIFSTCAHVKVLPLLRVHVKIYTCACRTFTLARGIMTCIRETFFTYAHGNIYIHTGNFYVGT